jgi:hypothetical protein
MLPFAISPAWAADDDIAITFLARDTAPISQGTPGHAFFCITLKLATGPKEDCFGFYPENLAATFGGPGRVNDEFTRNAIPNVSMSLRHTITAERRTRIYQVIEQWAGKDYHLLVNNCGDFMFAVAEAAGLKLPDRRTVTLPTEFLEGLKDRYWSGGWISSDAQSRFSLRQDGKTTIEWTERSASGATLSKSVAFAPFDDPVRIERANSDDVLTFLTFQPSLRAEILASRPGPEPSYLVMRRVDDRVFADWFGLTAIKDARGKLKELKQPGSTPAKRFEMDRVP